MVFWGLWDAPPACQPASPSLLYIAHVSSTTDLRRFDATRSWYSVPSLTCCSQSLPLPPFPPHLLFFSLSSLVSLFSFFLSLLPCLSHNLHTSIPADSPPPTIRSAHASAGPTITNRSPNPHISPCCDDNNLPVTDEQPGGSCSSTNPPLYHH